MICAADEMRVNALRTPPALLRVPPEAQRSALGADAVALAVSAGLVLDDWQSWVLEASLACREDRSWAASECVLVVPRQNGKGSVLEARQLAGLFLLDESLQIHTAHEFKTAAEHFLRIQHLIEGTPDLDRCVMRVRRGSGEQAVELRSGARLRFLARSSGSGRGLSAPTVYLDEAFALTAEMMGALLYAMSAQPSTQVWMTSSAPMVTSAVLANMLRRAGDPSEDRLLAAAWMAERDGDRWDRARWAQANPAFPHRIRPDTIVTELRNAGDDPLLLREFDRERLGIPDAGDGVSAVVAPDVWMALADDGWEMCPPASVALDVAPGSVSASFVAAQLDGPLARVEVVDRRPGADWVVAAAPAIVAAARGPLHVAAGSPAASKVAELRAAGVDVVEVPFDEVRRACQSFADRCNEGRLRHRGGAPIAVALAGAVRRDSGDQWSWSRTSSAVDITALVAATVAAHVAVASPRPDLSIF